MVYFFVAGLSASLALASAHSHSVTLHERVLQQGSPDNLDLFSDSQQLDRVVELALKNLDAITKDANGQPNPRVSCTDGHDYAAQYVSSVMQRLDLVPLGDNSSFFQVLPGSTHVEYCPPGMKNVVGMLKGTDENTTEKILFSAHLDGPNNQNSESQEKVGNLDTADAYDDGFAVALSLAIAEYLIETNQQPKKSVVFLFDDGEEGWGNVGVPAIGQNDFVCGQAPEQSSWYQDMNALLDEENNGCYNYPFGARYWGKNPTVDLSTVKLAFFADPLGSSYAQDTPLAIIGGEASRIGSSNSNMNSYVEDLIDGLANALPLLFIPRKAISENYSSMDAVTSPSYAMLCSSSCLKDLGVPSVWIAQPDFQKYHGGMDASGTDALFGNFFAPAKYPSTRYTALDNLENFDRAHLLPVASTITNLILNAANSELTSQLQYNAANLDIFTEEMLNSTLASIQVAEKYMNDLLPTQAQPAFQEMLGDLREQFSASDLDNSTAFELSAGLAGVVIGSDFFSVDYPGKEATSVQTFEEGGGTLTLPVVPTIAPTKAPTSASANDVTTKAPIGASTDVSSSAPTTVSTGSHIIYTSHLLFALLLIVAIV